MSLRELRNSSKKVKMGEAGISSPYFSIVIPVYNAERTIKECLDSIFASSFASFEVIVVDDGSSDHSREIVGGFPVSIITLERNQGPSVARNEGAKRARGCFLIFTDADCIFSGQLLNRTWRILSERGLKLLGGTYDPCSADNNFFSDFQAIYDYYYETKEPYADYLAAHFMVIEKKLFREVGGFYRGKFVGAKASCEDVDLSYRLKRLGWKLPVFADLKVKHYFEFNLKSSLTNAFKKSYLWAQFLFVDGTLLADSGVGSYELKSTIALLFFFLGSLIISFRFPAAWFSTGIILVIMAAVNRRFLIFIARLRGGGFTLRAAFYLLFPYCLTVGLGGFALLLQVPFRRELRRK